MQGNTLKHLRQLDQWQWMSQEQILTLQQERLKRLLSFACRHVPYYREVLKSCKVVNGSGAVNLNNFDRIPLLEKKTLRAGFDKLKSDEQHKLNWRYTTSGGSTGEPVCVIHDKEYSDWGQATKILDDEWSGYSIGTKQILLWGSEQDLFVGRETLKTHIRRCLRSELCLNAFRMTPERMASYVEKINNYQPVRIFAYSNSIYELARFVENKGLEVYSPRSVKTTASNLHKHMRNKIENIFNAPVYDCYGSREVGDIACECDHHEGLHVFAPTHYVEILRPDGSPTEPGEAGELVVTLLTNYAMPLIRYRIGDMGVWAGNPCTCGRGLPLLREVTGRMTDVFIKRDGGVVLPEYIIHLVGVVLNKGWILKYQVIQQDYDLVLVLIVPRDRVTHLAYADEKKTIDEKIRLVMGQECRVEFKFVDDIAPTATGKYRYTISKIKR